VPIPISEFVLKGGVADFYVKLTTKMSLGQGFCAVKSLDPSTGGP